MKLMQLLLLILPYLHHRHGGLHVLPVYTQVRVFQILHTKGKYGWNETKFSVLLEISFEGIATRNKFLIYAGINKLETFVKFFIIPVITAISCEIGMRF